MHVNFSFRRDDGSNAFHDPNDPEGLSVLARRCIAGVLAHHAGMGAIMAPNVNAYKRLQPDMLNGYWANWGHDDRSVTVRVPPARGRGHAARATDGRRLGEPVPGGRGRAACRPLRGRGRDGAQPAQPIGEEPDTDVRIPADPGRGTRRHERRRALVEALGPELVEAFTILKRGEWERYMGATNDTDTTEVTDWELRYYLPYH